MKGHNAWAVMRCMMYHLNKNIPYDGWKYNFRSSKLTTEKYLQDVNKGQQYGYAMLERVCPEHVDLIKFWYPLFRFSYSKPEFAIRNAKIQYKEMQRIVKYVEERLPDEELPDLSIGINGLPNVYNRSKRSFEQYFLIVGVFLKFPQLNTMAIQDPLGIYSGWLEQLNIDKKFLSLYITKDLVC